VSTENDFWLSCGHHLLDRDENGWLCATDEFMKLYLARPELMPPSDACIAERTLHAALLSNPWQPITLEEIDAIVDPDAHENWRHVVTLRDYFAIHRTLEATYLALVRGNVRVPPIFLKQLVHSILRNALDQCDDAYILRAAELFFRPQRLTIYDGSLLAADQEHLDGTGDVLSPLATMLGLREPPNITVLCDTNALSYWERSDRFDLALDLTAGRRGLASLGTVIARWVKHLLHFDVMVEPLTELREAPLEWYVGLDAHGTKIGDTLWNGAVLDQATHNTVAGLFRLTFHDRSVVMDRVAGKAVYLILAMAPDMSLVMKPQNLLTGLPVRCLENVT
jgi:hypothetical protein